MNYNKQFSKEEFLALPIYPHARGVPANTDFLLGEEIETGDGQTAIAGKMARQKEALLLVMEDVTKANVEDLKSPENYDRIMKVRYWRKLKDGNVSERGGHITMASLIDSMKPTDTVSINVDDSATLNVA